MYPVNNLHVPDYLLADVCHVLRAGLATFRGSPAISEDTRLLLTAWCEVGEAKACRKVIGVEEDPR